MQTKFTSKAQLLRELSKGQEIYMENHVNPRNTRVTTIFNINSTFFTTDYNGKESWIMASGETKHYGLTFEPDYERLQVFTKRDNRPFLTIHFNPTYIAGKKGAAAPQQEPQDYISTSEGSWRVISKGMPLCANTDRETAEKVASKWGIQKATIWNGDAGKFEPMPAEVKTQPVTSQAPSDLQQGRADHVLDSKMRYPEGVMSRREWLQMQKGKGAQVSQRQVPVTEFNRRKYNNMNYAEQEAYERKCAETKTEYVIQSSSGSYLITRTEYDHYKTLPEVQQAPVIPQQPRPAAQVLTLF